MDNCNPVKIVAIGILGSIELIETVARERARGNLFEIKD